MNWSVAIQLALGELNLDLALEGDSQTLALIGPNGSGKTTLLRTLAGAYRPSAGRIQVGDQVIFDGQEGIDQPPEARRVGYVPQGFGLFPHLSVVDNVAFSLLSAQPRRAQEERRAAAVELLERMGCDQLRARLPGALSGGEQQKVALARALMMDPKILLLDEPLAALDAAARRRLRAYLADHLGERGHPTIVVTHDVRDVLALDAKVCVLEAGRIVQQGAPQDLQAQPASAFVAEFFDRSGQIDETAPPHIRSPS